MSRPSLFKSSSLRIILSHFSTIIICFVIIGIIVAFMVEEEFDEYLNLIVLNTKSVLEESYKTKGKRGLLTLLSQYAKVVSPKNQIFFVADNTNTKIIGNIETQYRAVGWHDIAPPLVGIRDEFNYHVYGYKVEDLYILIGHSREITDELTEIFLNLFGYGSLVILLLVFINGIVAARKNQKRITKIGQTLDKIAQGNLEDRIVLSSHDDDIDQLSEKINISLNQLSSLFHGMKQVSANIAHDLKTPINRLNMHIYSAIDHYRLGEDPSPLLEKASAETAAINATFEALLRISQIEAGIRKSRFVRLDIHAALNPVIDAYQPVAEDEGYLFQTEGLTTENNGAGAVQDAPSYILADKELLMQMFANIIENAMHHCPKGSIISVRVQKGKAGVKIYFCDTGPGIPKAEQEKVFQPLYRLEKSRTTARSGLGLSLVKAIADLHHIDLSLKNNSPGLCVCFGFKTA